MEFLLAEVFYASFVNIASAAALQNENVRKSVEEIYTEELGTLDEYHEAWQYLKKYQVIFSAKPFHLAIVSFASHWDWYIRQIRTVEQAELLGWHGSLLALVREVSTSVALAYVIAPEYTGV